MSTDLWPHASMATDNASDSDSDALSDQNDHDSVCDHEDFALPNKKKKINNSLRNGVELLFTKASTRLHGKENGLSCLQKR